MRAKWKEASLKLVIANSQEWFQLENTTFDGHDHDVRYASEPSELLELCAEFLPDYIFVPHWNWLIPREITDTKKVIIFHTAPLPFGRGGSPIQNLIKLGFAESPVHALLAIEDIDAGPILETDNVDLSGNLEEILGRLNACVNRLIAKILEGPLEETPQKGEPFYFSRLQREDSRIDFEEVDLRRLFDKIRAVDGFSYPRAFFGAKDFLLSFSNANLNEDGELTAIVKIRHNSATDGH